MFIKRIDILTLICLVVLFGVFAPLRLKDKYNIFMAEPNWGLLEKSQTSDETIEEAIDRLIAAHDDDADAHIGAGKSLDTHKTQAVVDHPAESVVRDKLKFDRYQFDEEFNTIVTWQKTGSVEQTGYGGMDVATTNALNNKAYSYITGTEGMQSEPYFSNSPNWESRLKFSHDTNQLAYFGMMAPDVPAGLGFKVSNGILYSVYWDGDDVEQTTEIAGINIRIPHTYRMEITNGGNALLYVDGVLKVTIAESEFGSTDLFAMYQITTLTTAIRIIYVFSLHFDSDYSID